MFRIGVWSFAVVVLSSHVCDAGFISNGSFETPDTQITNKYFYFGGESIDGWRVDSGSVDVVVVLAAANGKQSLDLSGAIGDAGAISQIVATDLGSVYSLSFAYSGNTYAGPRFKEFSVFWGETGSSLTQVGTFSFDSLGRTPTDMGYVQGSIENLVATSSSMSVQFVSLTNSGFGAVIDSVALSAVPEPSTMSLFGIGAIGMGIVARRRAKKAATV